MSNLIIIALALLVLFIVWKIAKAIIKWAIIIVIIAVVAYLLLHGGAAYNQENKVKTIYGKY